MKKLLIFGFLSLILLVPAVSQAQTAIDIQARIVELTSLIQQLQAQLAVLQQGLAEFCHTFNLNLKIGDRGSEIEALHTALTREGFTVQETEGLERIFGEQTASAVTGFQEKYKNEVLIPVGLSYGTGYVGIKTRAKLNMLYGCRPTTIPVGQGTGVPTVTVLSPNGGETLHMGTSYNITWRSQNLPANVSINLYLLEGGTYIQTIATQLSNTGIYSWLVPAIEAATNLRIELRTSLEGVGDVSDRNFSILQPISVRIIQPNGGEILRMNSNYPIYWSANGFPAGATVSLYLLEGGTLIQTIATHLPIIPGIYNWKVPIMEAATNLRIELRTSLEGVGDVSDRDFSILPAISVRLIAPNGGEILHGGSNYLILWISTGFPQNATANLWLLEGGTYITNPIATNIPLAPGIYNWTVPIMEPATNFRVEIRTSLEGEGDRSDADFTIYSIIPY